MGWKKTLFLAAFSLLLAAFCLVASAQHGKAEICVEGGKVALLVANQNYSNVHSDLENPKRDIEAVGAALESQGWRVTKQSDLPVGKLRDLSETIGSYCEPDSILFYYAGEGESIDGIPYLAPADISYPSTAQGRLRKRQLVSVPEIARTLSIYSKRVLLILDGPSLSDQSQVPLTALLAAIPEVKLAVFSASAGQTVIDKLPTEPDLSPFARAFAEAVKSKGSNFDAVMLQVRDNVVRATSGQQTPDWYRALGMFEANQTASSAAEKPDIAAPADVPNEPRSETPATNENPAADIAPPTDPVALAAFIALDVNCARCHQEGRLGQRENPAKNFGNILQLDEIARDPNLILPGNPDGSRLFTSIAKKEQPYDCYQEFDCGHEPTSAEINAIYAWIKSLSSTR
jgi:hypothetical protein